MSDAQWEEKMKAFLKKTGEDFKRFGNDVKVEAQKLMQEVQDPKKQDKLREGLKDVGVWARKTAEEVATLVEHGVKNVEGALSKASDRATDFVQGPPGPGQQKPPASAAPPPPPAATPPSPPPEMDEAPAARPKKTVGKGAAKKKSAGKAGGGAKKKTIGKKAPPGAE